MESKNSSLKNQDINNLKFNLLDIWGPQVDDTTTEYYNLPYAPFIQKISENDEFKAVKVVQKQPKNPYNRRVQQNKYNNKLAEEQQQTAGKQQRQKKKNKLQRARHNNYYRQINFKQAIKFKANFKELSEMDKTTVESTKVKKVILEEICRTGTLKEYNKAFDRINIRQTKPLLNLEQYPIQASINAGDDDMIVQIQGDIDAAEAEAQKKYEKHLEMVANRKRLRQERKNKQNQEEKQKEEEQEEDEEEEEEEEENLDNVEPPKDRKYVYVTDAFLVALMSMNKSEFPWDIGVEKVGNHMVLDKFETEQQSYLDQIVMNENGIENPSIIPSDENEIAKNCQESTQIFRAYQNQVVDQSQEVIDYSTQRMKTQRVKVDGESDYDSSIDEEEEEEKQEPTKNVLKQLEDKHLGFRYVKINLDDQVVLNVRTQVDAFEKNSKGKYESLLVRTFNENNLSITKWRQEMQTGRIGTISTNILQQNVCLFYRWLLQMYLSGANKLKIGHVSRQERTPNNMQKHTILRTETYTYQELQKELSIYPERPETWRVVKHFVNYLMNEQQPDGRYLIQKPSQVQSIKFYYIDPSINSEEENDLMYEDEEEENKEQEDEE